MVTGLRNGFQEPYTFFIAILEGLCKNIFSTVIKGINLKK